MTEWECQRGQYTHWGWIPLERGEHSYVSAVDGDMSVNMVVAVDRMQGVAFCCVLRRMMRAMEAGREG